MIRKKTGKYIVPVGFLSLVTALVILLYVKQDRV